MKIRFDDIIHIFASYNVWNNERELLWYEKAWQALEKGGLTECHNALEKTVVLIRIFTLIMIYKEFCDLIYGEQIEYEFLEWNEKTNISLFRLAQLASREFEDEGFCEYEYDWSCYYEEIFDDENEYIDIDSAFGMLIENERSTVFHCLKKYIGEGNENDIFVSMYVVSFNTSYFDEEQFDQNGDVKVIKEMTEREKYEAEIKEYYSPILNDTSNMEAYYWVLQGTFRVR